MQSVFAHSSQLEDWPSTQGFSGPRRAGRVHGPSSLLASRWFWIGAVFSVAVWSAIGFAIR
jgi:hypothetical protein